MSNHTEIVVPDRIAPLIRCIREQRVILDADLATLYGVETRALVQAIKRNADRFPQDFLFQLTQEEVAALRSQTVILKPGRGQHRKYPPYALTEHGAHSSDWSEPVPWGEKFYAGVSQVFHLLLLVLVLVLVFDPVFRGDSLLYKTLSKQPRLTTLQGILKSVGLRMVVVPEAASTKAEAT